MEYDQFINKRSFGTSSNIKLKVDLLAHGVTLTENFLINYGTPFLEKRRAYGNPDLESIIQYSIPQEIITIPDNLVIAVNVVKKSPFALEFDDGNYFVVDNETFCRHKVTFPLRPKFYDYKISSGEKLSQIATLYGKYGLGIFVYGKCQLLIDSVGCWFCSLSANRNENSAAGYFNVIKPSHVIESIPQILADKTAQIEDIIINGGNFKNLDKGFKYYIALAKLINNYIQANNLKTKVELIVSPPRDLSLIDELKDSNISVIFNIEIYDTVLFKKYCPGKDMMIGQEHIVAALERAVNILGKNRVCSVLVGGLESIDSLKEGIVFLADKNIVPIINILHIDPKTPLVGFRRPSSEFIWEIGTYLQDIYTSYSLKPSYENCGRNSISGDAYKRLFL